MKKVKSKATTRKLLSTIEAPENVEQVSGNAEVDDAPAPEADLPQHTPLAEDFIEANIGKRFLLRTTLGEWEGRITGRRADNPGYWDALNQCDSLNVVSTGEIIAVIDSEVAVIEAAAITVATITAPDDAPIAVEPVGHDDTELTCDSGADTIPARMTPAEAVEVLKPCSTELTLAGHDYSQLGNIYDRPDDSWELPVLASFITCRLRRTVENAWWIGKALDIAHRKHTGDREWLRWLTEVGISKSSAYRLITLFKGYSRDDIAVRSNSSVYILLKEARQAAGGTNKTTSNENDNGDVGDDGHDCATNSTSKDTTADTADDLAYRGSCNDASADATHDDISSAPTAFVLMTTTTNADCAESCGGSGGNGVTDDQELVTGSNGQHGEQQPPVTEEERAMCDAYIRGVGGLARAVFILTNPT